MEQNTKPEIPTASEPPMRWERLNFDLQYLDQKDSRTRAEIETNRDLEKPIEQLLCDFHDMAELVIAKASKEERESVSWYMIHAQKRMVGMMAKVAASNERMSVRVYWLTVVAVLLGVVQLVFGALQMLIALCQS
jgi:hypothetical protein